MVSAKKRRKTFDVVRCVLIPVRESQLARWQLGAKRNGMSVSDWARERLNRIAPEDENGEAQRWEVKP